MTSFALLVSIAALMTAALIWVIRQYGSASSLIHAELLAFVLVMMLSMFLGASFYMLYPGQISLAYVVGGNMFVMVIGLVIILNSFGEESAEKPFNRRLWTPIVSVLLILNESMMGLVFHQAQDGLLLAPTPAGQLTGLVDLSVNTYWFFTPMMAEMISAFTMIEARSATINGVYTGLVGATAFPPTLLGYPSWIRVGFLLTFVALVYSLYIARKPTTRSERLGVSLTTVVLVTMVVAYVLSQWFLFALGIVAAMYWFYNDAFSRKLEARAQPKPASGVFN
ncbi:MAG: hypothetical protein QW767_04740 [Thermoprotei archaeon]